MSHDNNISIESDGTGNTFNINQHQATDSLHIVYTVNEETAERISKNEVYKGAIAFYVALALPILAIVADSTWSAVVSRRSNQMGTSRIATHRNLRDTFD